MMKILLRALLLFVISGLVLVGSIPVDLVHASTDVTGIISSDATWTKANSPYVFTGPVRVDNGVVLTIEPGVTLNLNDNYIRVEGTLRAVGSSAEKIYFTNGRLYFYLQPGWNGASASDSVIENAVLTSINVNINDTSVKINNNSIQGNIRASYSSSTISNNDIRDERPIYVSSSSVVISGNTIHHFLTGIECLADRGSVISNNQIFTGTTGIISGKVISNNIIHHCTVGVEAIGSTIEQNIIINNGRGIVDKSAKKIQNNTIANNTVGVYTYAPSQIIFNNIQDNSQYNIQKDQFSRYYDVNATFNWWGTTDAQAINQSIYDKKNDFNLGTVSFVPFLTEPNPQAMPNEDPEIPEFSSFATLLVILVSMATVMVVYKHNMNKQNWGRF